MARRKRAQLQSAVEKASKSEATKPKRKSKPKRKYRSREVSPSWRPKYGCGRLHWNMRNHGKIDVRRYKRKQTKNKADKMPRVSSDTERIEETSTVNEEAEQAAQAEQAGTPTTDRVDGNENIDCSTTIDAVATSDIPAADIRHNSSESESQPIRPLRSERSQSTVNNIQSSKPPSTSVHSATSRKSTSSASHSMTLRKSTSSASHNTTSSKSTCSASHKTTPRRSTCSASHNTTSKKSTCSASHHTTPKKNTCSASHKMTLRARTTCSSAGHASPSKGTEERPAMPRLIYEEEDGYSMEQNMMVLDDSLMDVTNVPDNDGSIEMGRAVGAPPPPVFPWSGGLNTNNNNPTLNQKSVSDMKSTYIRGGGLPRRKCAMYAMIRIHQLYNKTPTRARRQQEG